VLGYDLVTISAFSASGVALKPSPFSWLSWSVLVHGDEPHIYLDIMSKDESTSVQVPPVASFVSDEIAYQLCESYFQMRLYPSTHAHYCLQSFL
jgi:hypothetical protein